MAKIKTVPFDIQDYLDSPEARATYLNAALEDGDVDHLLVALGDVAKAIGMSDIATAIGMSRTTLYQALSGERDPRISTVVAVLAQLGLKIEVKAA